MVVYVKKQVYGSICLEAGVWLCMSRSRCMVLYVMKQAYGCVCQEAGIWFYMS